MRCPDLDLQIVRGHFQVQGSVMRSRLLLPTVLLLPLLLQAAEMSPADESKAAVQKSQARGSAEKKPAAEVGEPHGRPGMGFGGGMGFRGGRGAGGPGFRPDMMTIHGMFDGRERIRRAVTMLPDGARAITETDDRDLVLFLQSHVPAMDTRVLENQPLPPMTFHPLFQELIRNAEKYTLDYSFTDRGVEVVYQSEDPFVVFLVQEHAKLVSRFLRHGHGEIHAEYQLPKFDAATAESRRRALVVRDAVSEVFQRELDKTDAAKRDSATCTAAFQVACESVAASRGVAVGRTGLENEDHLPHAPQGILDLLAERSAEAVFSELSHGRLSALLPMRLSGRCVSCHEPPTTKPSAPVAALSNASADGAVPVTMNNIGKIVGWYWIEVTDVAVE